MKKNNNNFIYKKEKLKIINIMKKVLALDN